MIMTLVLLALSLSMDTLAASVSIGICKPGIRFGTAVKTALFFTFFQTAMPALGYFAGSRIIGLIKPYDHWIALGLLTLIGGKMIIETLQEKDLASGDRDRDCPARDPTTSKRLAVLAIATSIDALAAGISLAFSESSPLAALLIIGLVTFAVALAGTMLGCKLGGMFRRAASLVGGSVLILLGVKIVLEHLLVA
jgi:manganese efflux pump family protein